MRTRRIYIKRLIQSCILICVMSTGCEKGNKTVNNDKPTELTTIITELTPSVTLEATSSPKPTSTPEPVKEIQFHDPEFEALIRVYLGKEKITQEDLDSIDTLCLYNQQLLLKPKEEFFNNGGGYYGHTIKEDDVTYDVKEWTDLGLLTNLKRLILWNCNVRDLNTIITLHNLEYLDIQANDIEDYSLIVNLPGLKQLYMDLGYNVAEKNYLRDLPSLEDSDIYWSFIYEPTELNSDDAVQGITSGNLVNDGFLTCDGTNIYTLLYSTCDMAHGSLVEYNTKQNTITYIGGLVTEEMAKQWNCEPYTYLNEDIYSLNLYKNKLYYISRGTNESTSDVVEDGYYLGDDMLGIISLDLATKEMKLLTTQVYESMCIARDHMYVLDQGGHFIKMTLDGENKLKVTNKMCSFIYVNEDEMYFVSKDKKKLYEIKDDKEECILRGYIQSPIFADDYIFYLDVDNKLCRYNRTTQETKCMYDRSIRYYNVDSNSIYLFTDCSELSCLDYDGKQQKIIYNQLNEDRIQIVGDFLFVGKWWEYLEIKKDGSLVNNFVYSY